MRGLGKLRGLGLEGFRGLGFRGLGCRGLGFRGFRGSGAWFGLEVRGLPCFCSKTRCPGANLQSQTRLWKSPLDSQGPQKRHRETILGYKDCYEGYAGNLKRKILPMSFWSLRPPTPSSPGSKLRSCPLHHLGTSTDLLGC